MKILFQKEKPQSFTISKNSISNVNIVPTWFRLGTSTSNHLKAHPVNIYFPTLFFCIQIQENLNRTTWKTYPASLLLFSVLLTYLICEIIGVKNYFNVARFANKGLRLFGFTTEWARLSAIRDICFGVAVDNLKAE